MTGIQHIDPDGLVANPAYSQVVAVPPGATTIYVGGQNGVDGSGRLVGADLGSQAAQALANLRRCLEAAGASLADVVKWTILCVEGQSLQEGFAAFAAEWGGAPDPPAITFAFVAGLAVPGALVEIEAVAAVF